MVRLGDAGGAPPVDDPGMTSSTDTFQQTSLEAAEAYETLFVPAMFAEWAPQLCDVAGLARGQSVLDVACGTGIVARTAAERVGDQGRVTGLDLNEAMLTVARRLRPDLEWHPGDARNLPFPDRSFDVVLCQAALMFFPRPEEALSEMARVAAGTVALQVWGTLESSAGYSRFAKIVARHAGEDAVRLFDTYWVHGDLDELRTLAEGAGLTITDTSTREGAVRVPSLDAFVTTEVESTPLRDRIDEKTYQRIRDDAVEELASFEDSDGGAAIPIVGHLVAASPR
jgi:ubiquinone/menaquinone biosynthesis C-methylase UbiE